MTSVTELDLSQYAGKRVLVTFNEGSEAKEVEGTVQSGNSLGLLLKPRGKSNVEIIEATMIERVELAPDKQKNLNVKYVKNVWLGKARQHLLDWHGMTLTSINSITEEQAFEQHTSIDHLASDLGHVHGERPKKEKATDEVVDESTEAAPETVEPEATVAE